MLKGVMRLNALSCALFGVLFVAAGDSVSHFVGDPPPLLVQAIGAALIANAVHLLIEARKPTPPRRIVMYFVVGDALWVAGTIILIAAGLFITTPHGVLAASAVAVMVAGFAIGQAVFSTRASAQP